MMFCYRNQTYLWQLRGKIKALLEGPCMVSETRGSFFGCISGVAQNLKGLKWTLEVGRVCRERG